MAFRKMKNAKRVGFHTGLYAIDYFEYPRFPHKGKNWHIGLCQPDDEFTSLTRDGRTYPPRPLVIFAIDFESAQRAADLVHASRLLLDGSNVMSHLDSGEHAQIWPLGGSDAEQSVVSYRHRAFVDGYRDRKFRMITMHLPFATMVAAKSSFKLEYIYALAKLRVSFELASLALIDLDPNHSENLPKSPFPEDHVRMAHAVIAAWSCVEELGFEIRASPKKPSKLPDGSWNPAVKSDLEQRLRNGGVDLAETFPWSVRGPRTRIERKKPPQFVRAAEWAGWNVRDGEMEIIDAIHYVSFLRSWIATHKSDKQMIRVLSVYDVVNAQFLARRLLLERLGYWRYYPKKQKIKGENRGQTDNRTGAGNSAISTKAD